MAKTPAHRKQVADLIAGLGTKVTFHSADPGITGANQIATTPASGTTVWAAATDDGTKATAAGTPVTLQVPASTTVSHYGIWNGSTFLRGGPFDASITVNANGPVNVDGTPRLTYE
ncbi:hypothetical protein [Gordonia sp. (in: high G+C Gram-positive bacteria)]|uniref:hypothetical protein n=1 Tax=Gordonia sp. (in: high G+C Gram-positive bacteria) TaxID=84139 RepID=UPI003C72A535